MLGELIDLMLPRSCVGCGRDGAALCAGCGAIDVHQVPVGDLLVRAATSYGGGVRSALIAYKERGRRDLAGPLGGLLAVALAYSPAGAVLVPVPSSAAARRARGGDHLVRLARVAARRSGGRVVPALVLVRHVDDSAGLDATARKVNLAHAMAATRPADPRRAAVLVDDITTTGATLVEAARALRARGWRVGGAAVVAATPKRVGDPQPFHDIRTGCTPGTPGRAGLT